MDQREKLRDEFQEVRQHSLEMIEPLNAAEPYVQPMSDVSPPAWNLAHTTWFFKKILDEQKPDHRVDILPDYLFNSYYHAFGDRNSRQQRSMSSPTLDKIFEYRKAVDKEMLKLIETSDDSQFDPARSTWPNRSEKVNLSFQVTTGINHEQQHQELFYTEIKNIRWRNLSEFREAYSHGHKSKEKARDPKFLKIDGGLHQIGNTENIWSYDNEHQAHDVFIGDFQIQDRLVTNGDFLEFIGDRGYKNPLLWLSNGWDFLQREKLEHPSYWYVDNSGSLKNWTLQGNVEINPDEPVTHVSFYEADAFARWSGNRLPTESEWEIATRQLGAKVKGANLLDSKNYHPTPSGKTNMQFLGDVWEWTSSHYEPYPGFREFPGNIGEYNGKFMDNQRVLRGGSCVTPESHIRLSYRNFWPADTRFQFSGIRLVKDK